MQVDVYVNRERREVGGNYVDFSAYSAPEVVNYTSQGEGAPVVLIHGLAASLHDWDYLAPALAGAGRRACALDLLGHGESEHPARIEDYTAENVFLHLAAWIETLDLREPAVVIGHSLGGYLALDYALRFTDHVKALVLVNPFYSTRQLSAFMQLIFRRQLLNTSLIERTPYWLFRAAIDVTSLHFGGGGDGIHTLPEEVRIQTALDYKRADPGIYNIPRTMRDLTRDLPRVSAPALVIWGARDQTLAPASFPELVRILPHARGETLSPCGHVPHQCHAENFNPLVLGFLGEL
jgi:4,5:9,10-diseco-3-hydroxy-5,9,17-trioxoandrosta-1(10),2-diene-4-oate hydrolase